MCGVLATPVFAVFIIVASLITPEYNQLSDTISELGAHGSPYPAVINSGFVVYALLVNGFAYGLYLRLRHKRAAKAIWLLLVLCGIGLILSAVFHDDLSAPNAATSFEGSLHAIFSQAAFFAFLIAMVILAIIVRNDRSWSGFTPFTSAIVVISLLLSPIFIIEELVPIEGAIQRAILSLSLVWLTAVALRAVKLGHNPTASSSVVSRIEERRPER